VLVSVSRAHEPARFLPRGEFRKEGGCLAAKAVGNPVCVGCCLGGPEGAAGTHAAACGNWRVGSWREGRTQKQAMGVMGRPPKWWKGGGMLDWMTQPVRESKLQRWGMLAANTHA
jgi:hypothetical protein